MIIFYLLLPQQLEQNLVGKWEYIEEKGEPATRKVILEFFPDKQFIMQNEDETGKGTWKIITGKNESLLSLKYEEENTEEIYTLKIIGDRMILDETNLSIVWQKLLE